MNTVTEKIRELVERKQQFTSIEIGWNQFLDYLDARNGVDIHNINQKQDIRSCSEYVDANILENRVERAGGPLTEWFNEFERREDVLEALRRFFGERSLPWI